MLSAVLIMCKLSYRHHAVWYKFTSVLEEHIVAIQDQKLGISKQQATCLAHSWTLRMEAYVPLKHQ
jgi:hypothetical protein